MSSFFERNGRKILFEGLVRLAHSFVFPERVIEDDLILGLILFMFSFEIDVIVLIGYDRRFVLLLSLLDSKFAVGGGFEENFGRGGSGVFHLR